MASPLRLEASVIGWEHVQLRHYLEEGYTREIAKELGIDRGTVYR